MTVHFIGAGPGAPDLITVRGLNLIRRCPVVLYAGSLVPEAVVAEAGLDADGPKKGRGHRPLAFGPDHRADRGGAPATVRRSPASTPVIPPSMAPSPSRSGACKPSIFPMTSPQACPPFAAAAAELGQELTLPDIAQSVVLTRTAIRSSSMPKGESLANFAATGATLAIHLSINNLVRVVRELVPAYGEDCPVVVAYRVTWPDQAIIRGTLKTIVGLAKPKRFTRTALILVGPALASEDFTDSRLYAADHHHVLRKLPA